MRWACLSLIPLVCTGCSVLGASSDEEQTQPSAAQASVLEPPVISESFTAFPCPANPGTTIDLMGCAEHRILRSDEAINAKVRAIFTHLSSPASKGRFVRGERAWLAYRSAVCDSRADVYEGGSLAKVVFANCAAAENLAHLKDLRRFERDLRPK